MVNPRRVPWASERELLELYGWIWDDFTDTQARARAVARLSVYISSPSSPVVFPILHSLLTTTLLPYPPTTAQSHLLSRQSHALALIRMTNGLVDPLQMGVHARPMSLLARQIGLPPGLIGLRHEATHEDLPSLSVLREAVWKAIEYLRVESLEPLVFSGMENPSSSRSKDVRQRLGTQLDTLFRKHKRMMKGYFRERTSKSSGSGGKELRVLMREIEDLVEKVLGEEGGEDERESMGLDVITDRLLKPGCLVPLSIRKRPKPNGTIPPLDRAAIRIWSPLLNLISQKLASSPLADSSRRDETDEEEDDPEILTEALARKALAILLQPSSVQEPDLAVPLTTLPTAGEMNEDYMILDGSDSEFAKLNEPDELKGKVAEEQSFRFTLQVWLVAIWKTGSDSGMEGFRGKRQSPPELGGELGLRLSARAKEELGRRLVEALMGRLVEGKGQEDLIDLFRALRTVDPVLERKTSVLMRNEDDQSMEHEVDEEDVLTRMESRFQEFQKMNSAPQIPTSRTTTEGSLNQAMAQGWRKVDASSWKAVPIGVWSDSSTTRSRAVSRS